MKQVSDIVSTLKQDVMAVISEQSKEITKYRNEAEYWKARYEKQKERNDHIAGSNKIIRAKLDYYEKRKDEMKELKRELAYYQNGFKE